MAVRETVWALDDDNYVRDGTTVLFAETVGSYLKGVKLRIGLKIRSPRGPARPPRPPYIVIN